MAYQFAFDLRETVRQSPVRAALALVLLLASSLYFFAADRGYRVAEIGQEQNSDKITDLTEVAPWEDDVALISADDSDPSDAPAVTTHTGGRESYFDARVTHAVADDHSNSKLSESQIVPVSGKRPVVDSEAETVWLTGIIVED